MHGLVALKFGDHTAQRAGRLTLNPVPHIDPIGTILLPAFLVLLPLLTGVAPGIFIAWAKPVPVNPLNFRDIRRGELMVSLAGIAANFGLAFVAAVLYHLLPTSLSFAPFLKAALRFAVGINLMLFAFNIIPIPPLDGSNALLSQLNYNWARKYESISRYGFLIILMLLYTGIIGLIINFIRLPFHSLLGVPPL
jgi:Zn-dependent protease